MHGRAGGGGGGGAVVLVALPRVPYKQDLVLGGAFITCLLTMYWTLARSVVATYAGVVLCMCCVAGLWMASTALRTKNLSFEFSLAWS